MDLEEIDFLYKKDVETAEKEFTDGIAKKKNISQLENNFKNKLQKSRDKYYSSIQDYLKNQKNSRKITKKSPAEDNLAYKVDDKSTDLTSKEKKRLNRQLFIFKFKIQYKNFIRKFTPDYISFLFIRFKLRLKKIKMKISSLYSSIIDKIKILFEKLTEWLKESSKKMILNLL